MLRLVLYTPVFLLMGLALGWWAFSRQAPELALREPIAANDPAVAVEGAERGDNPGTLMPGPGRPSEVSGSWPCFRGAARDGVASGTPIASVWPETGPRLLWRISVGEGHAGVAVDAGRVYLFDYDEERKENAFRCLSLDDGRDIWRYTWTERIKRNHGMSRTVPAVSDGFVVGLGPRCNVVCLDAATGAPAWRKDLVTEYGTRVPEWYAGECPLVENGRVILGTGGRCLMTALELKTGRPVWETPNPQGWRMTHSSVLPVTFEGRRQYVWCASDGVAGVDAETGGLLWTFTGWRIKIATVPTPVDMGDGRLFLTGGYNAGSMMIRLVRQGEAIGCETLWTTPASVFGSDQQTPILLGGLLYGVIPGGRLACIAPDGRRLWVREEDNFGLGPYLAVDGRLLVLDDLPVELHLFDVSAGGARPLAVHRLFEGHDAWAPMAFVSGRLLARDATTLVCLDLR